MSEQVDIEAVVIATKALCESHERLNGKLCYHLIYDTPVTTRDLRMLVVMADGVTKSIRRVVDAVSSKGEK